MKGFSQEGEPQPLKSNISPLNLGASLPQAERTGLSACIFFACGKKGYRFNPLRVLVLKRGAMLCFLKIT
jgi:hypothetical protein